MAINTTFTSGAILTAAQMNNLPWGVAGLQTLTTAFTTTGTHTTFQANGMTLTITEVSGRRYKITALGLPYSSGGTQGVKYRIMRDSTSLIQRNISQQTSGDTFPLNLSFVYTSVASGTATYTAQIGALTNNTAVSDDGSATFPRQFVIEDLGPA